MKPFPIFLPVICILLTACNLPNPGPGTESNQNEVETVVTATARVSTQSATSSRQLQATSTGLLLPTSTLTLTPYVTETLEPGFGSISGNITGYPYGDVPQLVIVAFEQAPPYHYWFWINAVGNTFYSMDDYISTGRYQVVAYDPFSHTGGCTTIVEVKKNEMVTCDITNWGGGYPTKPADVP